MAFPEVADVGWFLETCLDYRGHAWTVRVLLQRVADRAPWHAYPRKPTLLMASS